MEIRSPVTCFSAAMVSISRSSQHSRTPGRPIEGVVPEMSHRFQQVGGLSFIGQEVFLLGHPVCVPHSFSMLGFPQCFIFLTFLGKHL